MRKKPYEERRKAQRLNISLPLEYRPVAGKSISSEKIFTRDISGSGVGLRLAYPVAKGARLGVLLHFPTDSRPVSSIGEIVWCTKRVVKGKKFYDVGVKHLKIAAKDRERFVFSFCE
ncbi:MAG: PilZ domain-containing protein, partial [Candidatus Omnitrophica bacterium]|nr:PilZ domain-containing protein [Candidatus Omnitrophota bacterium]